MEKLIIIGSGPAGLTAGIYAARGGLQPVILEGLESGGQLMQTQHVANYPGFPESVSGSQIIAAMRAQADKAGVRFVMDEVRSVDFSGPVKKLQTLMGDTLEAEAVIIASGAGVTKTNLPGEAKYWGRGISACLTCDGAFYAKRRVALVGEGSATVGATRYLISLGAEVVATVTPAEVAEFAGDAAHLTQIIRKEGVPLVVDGVFLLTARKPQTAFLAGAVALDASGHVVVTEARTSVAGVFAAGDCARPRHKQAVIAAGDGALAALEAQRYISSKKDKED